ncbi:MtrB/PioB family decaheme-associated outer membrane protein [Noviherbaspirillum sp.]|uniref:MtrB/PioB family decaheme-associated outer membrane protein n=1 Tax=Noviherbaspirillum sp. TaxID=1926288 RepID=UPI002B46FCD5|nr:MtrB/PioB family decaheme-associated outer membrane protein [Noviherbaspirillum sp.]HJV81278.1 MtrB/PioB family decaheme-associated outer membrane protein [Noviherbaspirillum sp.]
MKISKQHLGASQTAIALALLAAFGPACADEGIDQYIKPDSSVRVGVGAVSGDSKDRALFGQYNGMREHDFYGLLDVDVNKRDEASGTWTIFKARNLGLDTRELGFGQQRQGDWKYSVEYGELVRNYQNTINTGMQGIGSATPTVTALTAPGTGRDVDLQTKRKAATLNFAKWISPNLQFEANFKNEDKDGARLFGRGLNCAASASATSHILCPPGGSGGILLLPEPINSTTRQAEARLTFSGEKFLLSAAYNGSFYDNANGSLRPTIAGNLFNPNGSVLNTAVAPGSTLAGYMTQAMALAPDNQAHKFSLTGNYAFTPATKATFKYAYTYAKQDEDFASMGLTGGPAGVSNLGGRMDTTLAQAGVTSRIMPKLTLAANVRYEDRNNKTPVGLYSADAGETNNQGSQTKLNGKVEAIYQFAPGYRGTLGVDYEKVDFGRPVSTSAPGGLNLLRENTDELSYRIELRRSLSETFTGAISYIRSDRNGSDWLQAALGTPVLTDSQAAAEGGGRPVTPTMFQDRTRDKVRLSADWTPLERVSLQFLIEDGKDSYDSPHNGVFKGLGDTDAKFYGIDASFALSDNWKMSAYWNQGEESQHVNHSLYVGSLSSKTSSIGLGLNGKVSGKVELGGNLTFTDDKYSYQQGLETGSNTAATITTNQAFLNTTGGLPDTAYRATTLNLFGKYELSKNSGLRLDLIHQRAKFNDWAWTYGGVPFFFSDNTSVSGQQQQNVTFIGVSYLYKFQ